MRPHYVLLLHHAVYAVTLWNVAIILWLFNSYAQGQMRLQCKQIIKNKQHASIYDYT